MSKYFLGVGVLVHIIAWAKTGDYSFMQVSFSSSGNCTVTTAALAAFFFDHIEWDLIPRFNAPRELFVIYRVH